MFFDDHAPLGKPDDLFFFEDEFRFLLQRDRDILCRTLSFHGINHLDFLGSEGLLNNRFVILGEAGLEDIELIRIDHSLNYILSQSIGTGDIDHMGKPRFSIHCKHHP